MFAADGEDTSGCKSQCRVAAIDPDELVGCTPVFTHLLPARSRTTVSMDRDLFSSLGVIQKKSSLPVSGTEGACEELEISSRKKIS